jgi:hypothetical protein
LSGKQLTNNGGRADSKLHRTHPFGQRRACLDEMQQRLSKLPRAVYTQLNDAEQKTS